MRHVDPPASGRWAISGDRGDPRREGGWTLLEIAVGLTLIAIILLGVTATLSTAAVGTRNSNERVASQMLLARVLDEAQASPWDSLQSFNGMFVVEGDHRADITVAPVDINLMQIQVDVSSLTNPAVASTGVVLVAATD